MMAARYEMVEADVDATRHKLNRKPHRGNMEEGAIVMVQSPGPEVLVPCRSNEKYPKNGKADVPGSDLEKAEKRGPPVMEGGVH